MVTQRTVLVVANSGKGGTTYQQQLQQDGGTDYKILLGRSDTPLPALSQSTVKLDGILLEIESPYNRSFQLLRQLKEQTSAPVIVIDGGDTEVAVQAFKHGAADYLIKDRATPDDLRLAMRTAIENAELKRELQHSQETFHTSVENMLDCFGIFSALRDGTGQIVDFRIDYLNAAACESNQMSKAMQIGRGLCELLPAHHASGLFDEYCQVVETGEPLSKESLVYDDTFGGRRLLRAFDIRATKLNDGFVASWRDVTDRKQLELEQQQTTRDLQKNQEWLHLAMKAASMGSWDWNIQTGEVTWSTSLEHMFGMAPGSFDGRYETVRAMIHPEDLPRVEQSIQRALYDREDYNIEFRFFKPDGTVRWALSLGHVVYDDDGNPVIMVGVDRDITARKQAEVAIHASERRYRSLVEATAQIVWNTEGSQGEFITEQPGWSAFTGQTFDELKGWGWLDAVHPEDRAKTSQFWSTALKNQALYEVEHRLRRRDGVYRYMQVRAIPVIDENGSILEWLGVHTDITDSKQAEVALAENEARLRGFVEANVVGILYGDIYGNIHAANDELLRIVGYSQDDVRAGRLRWVEITPPEYLPLDEQGIAEARARGACTPYEKEYICKDGSRVPVLIGYSLLGEAREEAVVFVLDLSDRRQAELRLQESEQRLQLGMQVAGFALAQIDYSTNTVSLSPEAAALYGLSTDQLTLSREQLHATFHPEDRAQLEQRIQEVLDPAGVGWFTQDHRVLWSSGEVKWLAVRKQVFFDRSSSPPQPSHAILVALDITDRKQAEMGRDRLLEQEQTAREAAERANRIKDEFLAVLSHELRSPLNPILGWTKLLQSRKFDAAKTAEALATIERNAKLQTQLIDDLLDVAKILRGKLVIEMTAVDLAFVIESAIDTVRSAAVAKSIRLHSVLPQIGRISGDSARLQQIVWNLLSNAIKFTPSNGRVEILLERVGTQAQMTVSDTGKGINPEFLPYLFESFRQEDASTTRQYGGLGLGLAIVRSLVEAHGGTITADSPGEGQGATFTVRFPLIDLKPEVQPSEPIPAQDLDLTGSRVLAVDDEPDARELLAMVLTMYGAEVLTVTSAAEVLTALVPFQPDVLVSDVGMPEVDGYSLIQQIRTLPPEQGGQIPAIALTAYAREEDYQRAIVSGFQQQVTKPLEPELLVQAVVVLVRGLD